MKSVKNLDKQNRHKGYGTYVSLGLIVFSFFLFTVALLYSSIAKRNEAYPSDSYENTSHKEELVEFALDDISTTKLEEVSLLKIVDGDTITISRGYGSEREYVRLIGIDTPESVSSDESKNSVYGEMAAAYTKDLLRDVDTLYLEYDIEKHDKYDRTLAYVYLDSAGSMDCCINYILVNEGYALDKVYMPNNKYATLLKEARESASSLNKGLWEYEECRDAWNIYLEGE